MTAPAAIEVDEFLPHPVGAVWEALTASDRLAAWLMPNDFVPEVGRRFTFDTGNWGITESPPALRPRRHARGLALGRPGRPRGASRGAGLTACAAGR